MDIKILNKFNSKYTEFKKEVDSYIRQNVYLINENEKLKKNLENLKEEITHEKVITSRLYEQTRELNKFTREKAGATRKNIRRR